MEFWQLTSLRELDLGGNQLTSVPAEIGQLASLKKLHLDHNRLTSLPAEIGRLTSLKELWLGGNHLASVPAGIGRLSLKVLDLHINKLTSVPAKIGRLRAVGCDVYLDDGAGVLPAGDSPPTRLAAGSSRSPRAAPRAAPPVHAVAILIHRVAQEHRVHDVQRDHGEEAHHHQRDDRR